MPVKILNKTTTEILYKNSDNLYEAREHETNMSWWNKERISIEYAKKHPDKYEILECVC